MMTAAEAFVALAAAAAERFGRCSVTMAAVIADAYADAARRPQWQHDGGGARIFPPVAGGFDKPMPEWWVEEATADDPFAVDLYQVLPWHAAGGGKSPVLGVVELIGPDGMSLRHDCRAGLFFQPAAFFYTWHKHAAAEVYLPLFGGAEWFCVGRQPVWAAKGDAVHHLPNQPHAMRTDAKPLLALWGWTGDLSMESYEIT